MLCVFACDPEGLGFIELVEKFFGVAGLGETVFRDKAFEDAAGLLRSLGIVAREEQYVFFSSSSPEAFTKAVTALSVVSLPARMSVPPIPLGSMRGSCLD